MQTIESIKISERSFKILCLIGFWRPTFLTSSWQITIYNIYTAVSFIFKCLFVFGFLINLYQNKHKPEVYIENFFFCTASILLALKATYIKTYQKDITSFINIFSQKNCLPGNNCEAAIYNNYKQKERYSDRVFGISAFLTATVYILWPLTNIKSMTLPLKSWIPFAIHSKKVFWIVYAYQVCGVYYFVALCTTESLLAILMQNICAQLEILVSRLLKIVNLKETKYLKVDIYQEEYNIVKDCIDHHVSIFLMEKQLNDIFGLLVFLQFFVSILNVCTSGLYLTKVNPNGANFWFSIMIMCFFIFQIFTYCYFGEEMTTKSLSVADKIYQMDWNLLSLQTKQKLIIIMIQANNHPIQLRGMSLIIFSIETFFKVLKTSYSSYNLLRNSN